MKYLKQNDIVKFLKSLNYNIKNDYLVTYQVNNTQRLNPITKQNEVIITGISRKNRDVFDRYFDATSKIIISDYYAIVVSDSDIITSYYTNELKKFFKDEECFCEYLKDFNNFYSDGRFLSLKGKKEYIDVREFN